MRKLIASTFVSLDGIVQGPGLPEEDPTGGFTGKRLFAETAKPSALRLLRSQVSTTGVVISTYVTSGDMQPGRAFPGAEPSGKELARRERIANGRW